MNRARLVRYLLFPLFVMLATHAGRVGGADVPDVANRYNRLLEKFKAAPIHDSGIKAAELLQRPGEALAGLPKAPGGNGVDWIQAATKGKIAPASDLKDPKAQPASLDMDIAMEVKGSMPDVVFPHKQHTELLDCASCHPAIFVMQKGSNAMSMADSFAGKACGVCHGKVALPLSRCVACHSLKKKHAAQEVQPWVVK